MSKVDQNQAFRNVAFSADGTWTSELCPFQKANMNLYIATVQYQSKCAKLARVAPRSVRDNIPNSKLAQYSNYEYDEARELSYAPMMVKYERLFPTFPRDQEGEPWMLEEIDDLLIGFLSFRDTNEQEMHNSFPEVDDTLTNCNIEREVVYESPFLNVSSFEEMVLKLRIVSGNCKKIWESQYFPYFEWHPKVKTQNLALFKSPSCQMFSTLNEDTPAQNQIERDVDHIKALTRSLKEQNTWIFKKQAASQSWLESPQQHDASELASHRRLYSAVLQGTSPPMHMPNFPYTPKKKEVVSSTECSEEPRRIIDQNPLLHYPYFPSGRAAPTSGLLGTTPTYPAYHQYYPQANTFLNTRLYSNSFISNTSILNFRQTNYFPLVLQNASAPYSSFYSHQRGAFPAGYRAMVFPPRPQVVVPSAGWFLQPQVKVNILPPRPQFRAVVKPKEDSIATHELEDIVAKTVSAVLDESEAFVPVTGVPSDELELQALEQYSASNTNVFQELERQAAEQYETSENWKSPPKCPERTPFGGWLVRCLEGALGLGCSNTIRKRFIRRRNSV